MYSPWGSELSHLLTPRVKAKHGPLFGKAGPLTQGLPRHVPRPGKTEGIGGDNSRASAGPVRPQCQAGHGFSQEAEGERANVGQSSRCGLRGKESGRCPEERAGQRRQRRWIVGPECGPGQVHSLQSGTGGISSHPFPPESVASQDSAPSPTSRALPGIRGGEKGIGPTTCLMTGSGGCKPCGCGFRLPRGSEVLSPARDFLWLFLGQVSPPPGKALTSSQTALATFPMWGWPSTHYGWHFVEVKRVPPGGRWPGCESWLCHRPAAWPSLPWPAGW